MAEPINYRVLHLTDSYAIVGYMHEKTDRNKEILRRYLEDDIPMSIVADENEMRVQTARNIILVQYSKYLKDKQNYFGRPIIINNKKFKEGNE